MGGILNQPVETIHERIHYPCSQRCYNATTKPNLKGDVLLGQFLHVHNQFKFLGNLFFLFTLYQFMKQVESILQGDTVIATETVKDTSYSQLLSKIFKKGLFGGSSFSHISSAN